jgi:hypothetical protein
MTKTQWMQRLGSATVALALAILATIADRSEHFVRETSKRDARPVLASRDAVVSGLDPAASGLDQVTGLVRSEFAPVRASAVAVQVTMPATRSVERVRVKGRVLDVTGSTIAGARITVDGIESDRRTSLEPAARLIGVVREEGTCTAGPPTLEPADVTLEPTLHMWDLDPDLSVRGSVTTEGSDAMSGIRLPNGGVGPYPTRRTRAWHPRHATAGCRLPRPTDTPLSSR